MSATAAESDKANADYPLLFQPLEAGRIRLANRLMAPPHGSAIRDLFGSEADGDGHIAYWQARAASGIGWVDGITGLIDNRVPPGFEPSGIGARIQGVFRRPVFHERAARYADMLHSYGVYATGQVVHQGGMPHGASAVQSSPLSHQMPHVLDRTEIEWFVREFAFSALQFDEAGLDGVELHMNNDDLLQWFASPRTNVRTDGYGGSLANRMRFVTEIIESIRAGASPTFAVGVRLTVDEVSEDGYGIDDAIVMSQMLEAAGIDYLHGTIGSPWGAPSYVPSSHFPPGAWAALVGKIKREINVPVVYTARVTSPDVAEAILAAGHADVVGTARAVISDPEFVRKAREGRADEIRPCIGCNECVHRFQLDLIPFSCSVNPEAGRELEILRPRPVGAAKAAHAWRLLVLGGGPAGLELAANAAERGFAVSLWEREEQLGGQVRIAARAPGLAAFAPYIEHQARRLRASGADVRLGTEATAALVREYAADVVAVATGARSRRPDISGVDLPYVHDVRAVLLGEAVDGHRVVVVAEDDHIAPLAIAELLATGGQQVHVVYSSNGAAAMLGRYTLGTVLARLSTLGVTFSFMERVIGVEDHVLSSRNVFSNVAGPPLAFDSVVLACGSESESGLVEELRPDVPELHVLGDAFAPRRISFATRQASVLAAALRLDQEVRR